MAPHFFLTVGSVTKEIGSWRPRNCVTELQYRNNLYVKLEDAFRTPPTKEYGHGRARADIAFEKRIAIELKLDLNSTSKYQRLIGQLDDYSKAFGATIVVLVGDTERGLFEAVKKKARGYGNIYVVRK